MYLSLSRCMCFNIDSPVTHPETPRLQTLSKKDKIPSSPNYFFNIPYVSVACTT